MRDADTDDDFGGLRFDKMFLRHDKPVNVTHPVPASVRDMVHAFQREIRDTDLQPDRAAEILVKLSALIGNCNDQIRETDLAYAERLVVLLESNEKANRARIYAETSLEYQRKREARDTKELVIELCRSLKYLLKSHEEAMRLAR